MPQSKSSFLPAASTRYFDPVTVPAAPKKVNFAIAGPPLDCQKTVPHSKVKAKRAGDSLADIVRMAARNLVIR